VKEIMRHGVITVSPDESVTSVMNLMTRYRVRHIPVVRDGQLAGIVSIGDDLSSERSCDVLCHVPRQTQHTDPNPTQNLTQNLTHRPNPTGLDFYS
jgi:signal-transduction protein with cAMP-binding, CBS, and nucleotidyltransferase domain